MSILMLIIGTIGYYFGYKQSIKDKDMEHRFSTGMVYAQVFITFAIAIYAIIFTLYLLITALIR